LPFVKIVEDSVALPYITTWDAIKKLFSFSLSPYGVLELFVTYLLSHNDLMIKHFNKRGIFTQYWTLNEEYEIKKAFKHTSVNGVLTDAPTLGKSVLMSLF